MLFLGDVKKPLSSTEASDVTEQASAPTNQAPECSSSSEEEEEEEEEEKTGNSLTEEVYTM